MPGKNLRSTQTSISPNEYDPLYERYEALREWKARFHGRRKICWLNKSKHQELSRAFMAVSRFVR